MKKKCVFAGTFDPPTVGHKAIIDTCSELFDEVVIAMLINPDKTPYFSVQQRKEMLRLTVGEKQNLTVKEYWGTIAQLLEKENTRYYVRGIRNTVDFEYENANFFASKKLNADMVALYLPCPQEILHVSSSMVRNSLRFKTPIVGYVTKEVEEYIYRIFPDAKA